jgi:hypothetical protein
MTDGRRARRRAPDAAGWFAQWLALVVPLAVIVTVVDSLLLQRSRSFFTGGFLAADHITRPGEAASFLATSLLADVTLIGIAVAITLWVAGQRRWWPSTAACVFQAHDRGPAAGHGGDDRRPSRHDVLTDFDRDGYGSPTCSGGRPTRPVRTPRIYPYALEIPGNGIDENGVGGDLPADWPAVLEPPPAGGPWRSVPDVVLIVLESFRADAIGATSDGRPVTPVLDAIAARGACRRRAPTRTTATPCSRGGT